MPDHTVRIVLDDVEIEVLAEALEIYLRARPAAADHRFDYRYRAAQGILGALSQPRPDDASPARGGDGAGRGGDKGGGARIDD